MDVRITCLCPLKDEAVRHPDGDTVTLRDKLDFHTVMTIRKSRNTIVTEDDEIRLAQRLARFTEFYMLLGIVSWTLVDGKGKPIDVSHQAIRDYLFTSDQVEVVSEAAEELYNPVVLLPLMDRASTSSPGTPTPDSISPTSTPPSPLKPSRRSSTITTPTGGTETTSSSLDGVSNISPRSESAA